MITLTNYLDVVDGENTDHRVVFAFIPVLIDLSSDKYNVSLLKRQFPANIKTVK